MPSPKKDVPTVKKVRTPFGKWFAAQLAQRGLDLSDLKGPDFTDYIKGCIEFEYPHVHSPSPTTLKCMARVIGVSVETVRERLDGGRVRDDDGADLAPALARAMDTLGPLFAGQTEILTVLGRTEPEVVPWGGELPVEIQARAAEIAGNLRLNQPHLLLAEEPDWSRRPLALRGIGADFAAISALREAGEKPAILSASAVVCTDSPAGLVLHRRAALSATYANCLHTLGGAYHPDDGSLERVGTDQSLSDTAAREVFEESRLRVIAEGCHAVMLRELRTGFIQYLAVDVHTKRAATKNNEEGLAEFIPHEHLLGALLRERWVPTGRLSVLLWLAAGAPGAPGERPFDGLTAQEVLDAVVRTAPLEHADPK